MKSAQRDAHGNIQLSGSGALGDRLAELIKERLTPKGGKPPRVRADTFGYLQRCWPYASAIDAREARLVGREAARLALTGLRGASITIRRISPIAAGVPYQSEFGHVDLSAVAAKTRTMPGEFIKGHNDVSGAFIDYCRPLIGALPEFERL
jgi:6-phosphofructokinase 1